VVLAVAAALVASGCQPPHADPTTIHRVVLVGDSLGTGVSTTPGIIDDLPVVYPNATIQAAGGPATGPLDGFDPAAGTSNWSRELDAILRGGYDADIVIIEAVGRNYAQADVWRAALDAVVAAGRANDPGHDRRIIMATSPRLVPGTSIFEQWGLEPMIEGSNAVMRAYPDIGLADIDAAWAVDGKPVWDVPGVGVGRAVDGLHYSAAGAADAARLVAAA
jgi:hypothetical protein